MSIVFSGIEQPAVPLKNDVSLIFPMRFIFVKILIINWKYRMVQQNCLSTNDIYQVCKEMGCLNIFLNKFTNKWCKVGYDTEDGRSNFAHRLAAPLRPVAKLIVSTWPCHQSLQSSNPCRDWTNFFIIVFVVSNRYSWVGTLH